jgi:hypothetical protein
MHPTRMKYLGRDFILNESQMDCPRFESRLNTHERVLTILRYGNVFLHMYPRSVFVYQTIFARIFRTIHFAEHSGRAEAQVSTRLNTGIVGSNPTSGVNICFHSVFVLLYLVCCFAIG